MKSIKISLSILAFTLIIGLWVHTLQLERDIELGHIDNIKAVQRCNMQINLLNEQVNELKIKVEKDVAEQ